MVIWSESLDRIVPICQDFEERLIKLLWRSRPAAPSSFNSIPGGSTYNASSTSHAGSVQDHSSAEGLGRTPGTGSRTPSLARGVAGNGTSGLVRGLYGEQGREYDDDLGGAEKMGAVASEKSPVARKQRYKRTWYGRKIPLPMDEMEFEDTGDVEGFRGDERRPVRLYAPLYNGLAAGLAMVFVGNSVRTLLMEWWLDHDFTRFALVAVIPLLYCVSLVSVGFLN